MKQFSMKKFSMKIQKSKIKSQKSKLMLNPKSEILYLINFQFSIYNFQSIFN